MANLSRPNSELVSCLHKISCEFSSYPAKAFVVHWLRTHPFPFYPPVILLCGYLSKDIYY